MSEDQSGHLLVQADVAPLDEDGVGIAAVGTALFAVATVVCAWQLEALTRAGHRDWLWICLVGTALGLVGVGYCRARSRRNRG